MMPTDGLSCVTNFTSAKVAGSGRLGVVRNTYRSGPAFTARKKIWASHEPKSEREQKPGRAACNPVRPSTVRKWE